MTVNISPTGGIVKCQRCEQYKRQVGGTNAANSRLRQENKEQARRIRQLERLTRDMYAKLLDVGCGMDEIGGMAERMESLGIGAVR